MPAAQQSAALTQPSAAAAQQAALPPHAAAAQQSAAAAQPSAAPAQPVSTPAASANGGRFAAVLRELRLSAGLTQRELGHRAALSERAIRDLERGRVARPRQDTIDVLAGALGLDGVARGLFADAARRRGGFRPWWAAQPALIGRDADVVDVASLLAEGSPLVTLVGVAGVGKTALAMAVAAQAALDYPGGVALVPVVEAIGAADLARSVAESLGAERAESLEDALAGRRALVVLDGAERSWEAARSVVAWLARSGHGAHVLATSRQAAAAAGERVFLVRPLAVPPTNIDAEQASRYPAVQLFLDRLRRVRHEPLSRREAVSVTELARRLDGLPLALEFAATRGRLLTVDEILERYANRVLDLGGTYGTESGRTTTLKNAIADTYDLLSAADRRALSTLTVFRGPWPARHAERLLEGAESLTIVERLTARGLVNESVGEERRFRLLRSIRDEAVERGDEKVLDAARDRHAEMFADIAEEIAPGPAESDSVVHPSHLDTVTPDLRAALRWTATTGTPSTAKPTAVTPSTSTQRSAGRGTAPRDAATQRTATAVRIAASLVPTWRAQGRGQEGRDTLARLLAIGGDRLSARVVARARHGLAVLASDDGDMWTALAGARRALAEHRAVGDVDGELASRGLLVDVLHAVGDYDEARHHAHAAIDLATREGHAAARLTLTVKLVRDDVRSGALNVAREHLTDVRQDAARCSLPSVVALIDRGLAEIARLSGRSDESEQRNVRALLELRRLGDEHNAVPTLCALVKVRVLAGRSKDAQLALDEARAIAARLRTSRLDNAVNLAAGYLSLVRGERHTADRCFSAVIAGRPNEPRDLLEAHVGLALARAADRERADRALTDLGDACRRLGFVLCPSERTRLARAGLPVDPTLIAAEPEFAGASKT